MVVTTNEQSTAQSTPLMGTGIETTSPIGQATLAAGATPLATLQQLLRNEVHQTWQIQIAEWNQRYPWLNLSVSAEQMNSAIRSVDPSKSPLDGLSLVQALSRGTIFTRDLSMGPPLAAAAMFRSLNSVTGNIEENPQVLPPMENVLQRFKHQDTCDDQKRLLCAILLRGEGRYTPRDADKATLVSVLSESSLPETVKLSVSSRYRL